MEQTMTCEIVLPQTTVIPQKEIQLTFEDYFVEDYVPSLISYLQFGNLGSINNCPETEGKFDR